MAALFSFEVYTPNRIFYSDSIEAIVLTLADGDAAVYANHVPFAAPVISCPLKIKDKNGTWKTAFTAEGILEVTHQKTILISNAAEWPEEIDYERAQRAKEKAQKDLEKGLLKFETETATASLKRANMRFKVREEGLGKESRHT